MSFKRLSSFILCFMLVFAAGTAATASPSLLNGTWEIVSGAVVGSAVPGSFVPGSASNAVIQIEQSDPNYLISINDGVSLSFSITTPQGTIEPLGIMHGGAGFQRGAAGEYSSQVSGATVTYKVNGDRLEYTAVITPGSYYTRLTLQRVCDNGGAGCPSGCPGARSGGGCNAGFGLLALGFVLLPFFYRRNRI